MEHESCASRFMPYRDLVIPGWLPPCCTPAGLDTSPMGNLCLQGCQARKGEFSQSHVLTCLYQM